MTIDSADFDRRVSEKKAKEEAALPAFRRWAGYLHLNRYGHGVPAFDRLRQARWDVQEWRRASGSRGGDYEQEMLAVRVVAEALAEQLLAAATDEQDPSTVAWAAAGLRCPMQPFCTGCVSCQTVTSPGRPAEQLRSSFL